MSDEAETMGCAKPSGIALLVCQGITSEIVGEDAVAQKRSCMRNFHHTIDTFALDHLPHTVGPIAAYVLVSGSGQITLALVLEAPNGEIVLIHHLNANTWGMLGTHEFIVHVDQVPLARAGVYRWQLLYDYEVILERPMLVSSRT